VRSFLAHWCELLAFHRVLHLAQCSDTASFVLSACVAALQFAIFDSRCSMVPEPVGME
jgi:hypothetical protein